MSKYVQIENEIINLENVDYINKKEATKGKQGEEGGEKVHVLTVVMKSGVQISMPFSDENACDYIHKRLRDELKVVKFTIPTLKEKVMAKGLNKIEIIGHVGQTPEVKNLESGVKVVALSVATSKTYKKQDGQKETVTQWHRVVAWRKLAEIVDKYVNKGDKVYFEGEMTYRTYETQEGEKRQIAEIVANDLILLTPKAEGGSSQTQHAGDEFLNMPPQPKEEDEDGLPF